MSANKSYANRLVGQAVDVSRFEAGVRQEILGHLHGLEQALVAKIKGMDLEGVSKDTYKRARAETMLQQVRKTIGSAYQSMNGTLREHLVDLSKVQAKAMNKIAKDVFKGSVLTTSLTPKDLRVLASDVMVEGNPTSEWWKRQAEGTRLNFSRAVREGIAQGESTPKIVERIIGKNTGAKEVVVVDGKQKVLPKRTGGVMEISKRQAETLVRTSTHAVSNEVMKQTYAENGDVLRGVQCLATLDLRTCEICIARDGGVWDPETGEPLPESKTQEPFPGYPPWHPNDRCVMAPITKSWAQMIEEAGGKPPKDLQEVPEGTRASMDGQVPGKTSYEDWLRAQPEARQLEVLGEGKYALFKEGKIGAQDLLNTSTGKPMSLKALKAQAGEPPPAAQEPDIGPVPLAPAQAAPRTTRPEGPPPGEAGQPAGPPEPAPEAPDILPTPGAAPTPDDFAANFDDVGEDWLVPQEGSVIQSAYRQHFGPDWEQHKADLGGKRVNAIYDYTGAGYHEINGVLREGGTRRLSRNPEGEAVALQIDLIKDSINRAPPTKFDMVVFRGDEIEFDVGSIQTLKGFTSTTLDQGVARSFADENVFYEIFIPAGSRGVLTGLNAGESEVLLQHGAKVRVVGKRSGIVNMATGRKAIIHRLEYLGL